MIIEKRGKLLLTGEYVVLDGAQALAVPTKPGQSFNVSSGKESLLTWYSYDSDGKQWFNGLLDWPGTGVISFTDSAVADRLSMVFHAILSMNSHLGKEEPGLEISSTLGFPRDWGLGSSSTLIAGLADWAMIDPYELLKQTFGGSGYDIACADARGPILYQLRDGKPVVESISYHPTIIPPDTRTDVARPRLNLEPKHTYFVYLGNKQDSRQGIAQYRSKGTAPAWLVDDITKLTHRVLAATTLAELMDCLQEHEERLSAYLGIPRVQTLRFPDFPGQIKSLGAWGGDFVWAVTDQWDEAEVKAYFLQKGLDVCFSWDSLIYYDDTES